MGALVAPFSFSARDYDVHFDLILRSFLIVTSSSLACLLTFDFGYFVLMSPRYVRASVQFFSSCAASAAK